MFVPRRIQLHKELSRYYVKHVYKPYILSLQAKCMHTSVIIIFTHTEAQEKQSSTNHTVASYYFFIPVTHISNHPFIMDPQMCCFSSFLHLQQLNDSPLVNTVWPLHTISQNISVCQNLCRPRQCVQATNYQGDHSAEWYVCLWYLPRPLPWVYLPVILHSVVVLVAGNHLRTCFQI